MKLRLLFLLLILFSCTLFAQNKPISGFVVDKDSKLRLAKVYLYNANNGQGIFNNNKGEFSLNIKPGDTIFAALQGYAMDTVVYKSQNFILFQLKSLAILLKEVPIYGKSATPKDRYSRIVKDYKYALDRGNTKDLFNLGLGGVGLGIDAIYNLLSRQGKNARFLQKILEADYKESIIDYRYKPEYVKSVLGIADEAKLTDFMGQYRPTYQFTLTASDYSFVLFLRNSYASYKRNPAMFRLPTLRPANQKN